MMPLRPVAALTDVPEPGHLLLPPALLLVETATPDFFVRDGVLEPRGESPQGEWRAARRFQTSTDGLLPLPEFVGPAPITSTRILAFNPQLEAALAIVQPEKVKKNVFYLASDAMKGRDTPSPELTAAQDFFIDELTAHGFQPAGTNGYRYPWKGWGWGVFDTQENITGKSKGGDGRTVLGPTRAKSCTKLTLTDVNGTHHFRYGDDYFYSSLKNKTAGNLEITGAIALAGIGTAEDFARANVKDKWVMVFDSPEVAPDERREIAKALGAKGLIVVPNPDASYPFLDRRRETLAALAKENKLQYAADADFDEITVTQSGATLLMPLVWSNVSAKGVMKNARAATDVEMNLTDQRVLKKPFAEIKADNVAGLLEGSDPVLSKEVVIVSAHLDHIGMQGGKINNGADDNASGSAGLLALIEALKVLHPGRSILILSVSGEEKGLLGSAAWTKAPSLPAGYKAVANINIDMIGRNAPERLHVTPTSSHPRYNELVKIAEAIAPTEGYPVLQSGDEVYSRSDHYNFDKYMKIPIIFFSTWLHPDYHKSTDDPEKIDTDKIARVVRLVVKMIDEMDRNFKAK